MLDDRARTLLKLLVERYIADGTPVGSRTLSRTSGLDLSPATIRNVMADLEDLGLIASPHTSAGRVPTARGYRLFVDTMLTAQPLTLGDFNQGSQLSPDLAAELAAVRDQLHPDQPQRVIAQAASLLSQLSSFVGVVMSPRKETVFRHIEFLRLGERRVLVILVAPDGDVQNRVLFTARDYAQADLIEATNFVNAHYAGLGLDDMREKLKSEVDALRGEIALLMQAAVQAGTDVMADLEELGLIASPHTSAGRIPTARGYRLFVDTMLTARPREFDAMPPDVAAASGQLHPDQPQRVIAQAASLLSSLSSFVGVVTAPRKASVFHHIEFLRLGEKRVLVILVAPDGDVQNRVIFTARDYAQPELLEATNYLNAHYAGLTIEEVRERLKHEIDALRGEIATLMQAAVQAGSEVLAEATDNVVVSGERNLLTVQDFGNDMSSLRRLFDVFEQKTELMRLLDVSSRAEGVRIYIGGESRVVPFEELSVVTAPYEVDGRVVGTLGVIGPTRMAYDRMIQIVDITSRLVGHALSVR